MPINIIKEVFIFFITLIKVIKNYLHNDIYIDYQPNEMKVIVISLRRYYFKNGKRSIK